MVLRYKSMAKVVWALMVLCAGPGGLAAGGPAAADDVSWQELPACQELARKLNPTNRRGGLGAGGERRAVELQWAGGPLGRAEAQLLRAALALGLGLPRLRLPAAPAALCQLADRYRRVPDVFQLSVSAQWAGEACDTCEHYLQWKGAACPPGAALAVLGAAPAARLALHRAGPPAGDAAPLLAPTDADDDPVREFELCAGMEARRVARSELVTSVTRAVNVSFLFLDYDVWEGHPGVERASPCGAAGSCAARLGARRGVRALSAQLRLRASPAARALARLAATPPPPAALRAVLALQARARTSLEHAVCLWAARDDTTLRAWIHGEAHRSWVPVCRCVGDPDNREYAELVRIVEEEIGASVPGREIKLYYYTIDCSDEDALRRMIEGWHGDKSWFELMGVVARGDAALGALEAAARRNLPLLLYGPGVRALRPPLWAAAGRPAHVARALRRLLADCGWARVAVLSERSREAAELRAELARPPGLVLRDARLPPAATAADLVAALAELRGADARVSFVNAGHETAAAVLAAARDLNMTAERGFVWIVREWRCPKEPAARGGDGLSFYSVSLGSCRAAGGAGGAGGAGAGPGARVARRLRRRWADGAWPPRAAPLADALLSLVLGHRALLAAHPDYDSDLHYERGDLLDDKIIRDFSDSLTNEPIEGVGGEKLIYKDNALAEPLVYVETGTAIERTALVTWRVREDGSLAAAGPVGAYPPRRPPADGAAPCALPVGDPWRPRCRTAWAHGGAALAALAAAALGGAGLALRRRLRRRDAAVRRRASARHAAPAAALAALLVPRAALRRRGPLGAGRHGRVWLGELRGAGPPRHVAVKEPRADAAPAEDAELLREACALAGLAHPHVARLLGVVADGPPRLLLEYALFGDLRRYLWARRALWERAASGAARAEPEAAHVGPEELTRLAREACSALGYLSARGLVHRDVRAANCLLDAARRLKLADFAMARPTAAAEPGAAPEYACRRRALFPVLWMAPESLARGVFSAASDVWALGVLVLELVTLGGRPYGSWAPLRVLHHVAGGGRPDLPRDASPLTRGVALACWQRSPARRCSAAQLESFLANHPRALRPALQPLPADEPTDADSGFGETPPAEHN